MHTKTLQVKIPQKLTQALNRTKQITQDVEKQNEPKLTILNFKNKYAMSMYTGAYMLSSDYDPQHVSIGEVVGFFPKENRVLMLFRSNDQKQMFTETAIPAQLMTILPDKFSCLEIPRNINEQLFLDDNYNYDPEIYSRQASRTGMRQQYQPKKKNEETSYMSNPHLTNMLQAVDQLQLERLVRDRYKKDLISQFKSTVNYYVERIPKCDFLTYDDNIATFYKRYIASSDFQVITDQEQFDMMFTRLHRSCKFQYNQQRIFVEGEIELTLKDFDDFEEEVNQVINEENREKLRQYYIGLAEKNKINTANNKAVYNKNRTFDSYYMYNNAPTIQQFDKYDKMINEKVESRRQIIASLTSNVIFQGEYFKCRIIVDNMIKSYLLVVSRIGNAQPALEVVENVKFSIEIADTYLKDTQLKLIGENILSNLNSLTEMNKLISEQTAFQQYIEEDMKQETPRFLPYLQIWNIVLNLFIPYSRILYCRILNNTEISRKMFDIITIQFLQSNNDFPLKVFIGYLLTIPQERHFQGETEIMLDSQIDNYNEKVKDENLQKNFKQLLYLERDIYVQRQTLHKFGIFTDPNIHSNRFPFHVNINYLIQDGNFIAQPSIEHASQFFGKFLQTITRQLCYVDYSYFYSTYEAQINTFKGPDQNKEYYYKQNIFPTQNIQLIQYKMNETINFIHSSIEMITEVINVSMSTNNAEEKFQQQGIEEDLKIFQQLSEQIEQNNKDIEEKGIEYQIDDYFIIKLIKGETQLPKTISLNNIYNIVYIDILNKRRMAELFNDKLYFYIFNLNVTELKSFLQQQYNRIQQNMQLQTIEYIKKFTESLINNMRLLIYTTRSFERSPQLFNRLYYLQDFLTKPEIKSFFTQLFQLLTFISEQYQNIFLCQEIQPIVDDIYRIIEEMYILEDYTKQRKDNDVKNIQHDLLNSKYQYCNQKELGQEYQKLSKKLQIMCQQVHFGEIDTIQLPYIAYHRMIRELKLTQIVLEKRKVAYQQYIKIFSTKLQEYNTTLTGYIKNKLFSNLASTLSKFQEAKYNNIEITELRYLAGSIQNNLNGDADDLDEYKIPLLSIELNKLECDDLLKKFELEFLQEIQTYTVIELQSLHSDESVAQNRQKIDNDLTNKIFEFLQNEESSIKHFYNDNIIIFAKNITTILFQFNNILNLLQLIQNWEGWLDILSETNNNIYGQIIDQIIEKTLYYTPLCYLLNNYLIILSLHYQSKKYQLNKYPYQSVKMRLQRLYKNIIIYKQQFNKFTRHISNNDIKITTQQINLLIDRIVYSIIDLYPEISIAIALTSEFILPQQLTIIQKQYVFVDMGLNILAGDIFKQNKKNNDFYYVCLGISLKSYFDKLVFENVRKIYNFISQFTLEYRIEDQQIYIYIEPIHFQDSCQKFLLYISIILNMYQNDIDKQVLIFLRDIESMLLYIREFYLGIVRLQNLVNDLLQVKMFGNVIEIDFNQVTNNIINDVKEKRQAARMQRKLKKQLEQGISLEYPTQEKTIADNVEYLKKRIQQQQTEKQNRRVYSVNILSSQEILQINGAFSMLKDICNKVVSKDETLLRLADEHNYLKQLRRYVVELDQIQVRIKSAAYANAFRVFTTKQNQRLNNMQQAAVQTYYNLFTLGQEQQPLVNQQLANINLKTEMGARAAARIENFKQYQLVQSQLVHSVYPPGGHIIPTIHGRTFRQQLQFRTPILMQYGDFMTWHPLFLKNKELNKTFFDNITDFMIEDSQFRGKILTRLISDYEVFPLKAFVQCPDCMYKFPDLVYEEIHESIIQQVTQGNIYLQNKEFENFMKKIVYQAQIVCVSTLSKDLLQELKQYLSIDENKEKHYIPIMCRIEERCQYDHVIPRIELNDNKNKLLVGVNSMACYNIYLGKPVQSEFQLLRESQYEIINQILQGISQRNAIFMLTNVRENQQIKRSLDQIYTHVSRITFRKYQKMYLSQYVFQEQFDELQIKILSGYLIIIYGMDQLTVTQQSILIDFVLCIQNRRGEIQNIFQMEINQVKIDAIRQSTEKKQQLSYEQIMTDEDLLLRKSDYRDFEQQLGYVIIQLSCISDQYEKVPGETDNTSIIMLTNQDRYTQLFGQFKDKMLINAVKQQTVSNTLLNDFLKISHQFGNEFYNLATLIDKFNSNFSKINVEDIELVVGLVGDANSNFALASFLVDLLLRQYTEQTKTQHRGGTRHNIQDGFQEYSENNIYQQQKIYLQLKKQTKSDNASQAIIMNFGILSNLISSVFGLTKQQQTNLFQQAKAFGGILLKSKGLMRLSKQSNFNRYYTQFLMPILSKDAVQKIQAFATEHQVSISLVFEITVLQQILSLGKPVLIDCQNQQYMQVLSQYLSAAQGGECYIVGTWQEFELIVQRVQGSDVIAIIPTSLGQLQRMLPRLQSPANKKAAKILVLQPRDVTPDVQRAFERRFSLVADLTDLLFLNKLFMSNKTFLRTQLTDKLVDNLLQSQELFSKNCSLQYFKKASMVFKVSLFANIYYAAIIQFLHTICKIYQIGSSLDEFLLIRSISDFFLLRFGVFKVINYADETKDQILDAGMNPVELQDEKVNGYIQQKMVNGKKDLDEQFYQQFNYSTRCYSVKEKYGRIGFSGLQHDELQNGQNKPRQEQQDKNSYFENIFQTLLKTKCNGGKGGSTNLWYTLNDIFVAKLSQLSMFKLIVEFYSVILASIFNAAYLITQFQLKATKVLQQKQFEQVLQFLREYDPEKLKNDNLVFNLLNQAFELLILEHRENIYNCPEIDLKNKYDEKQNLYKSILASVTMKIPNTLNQHAFIYLNYDLNESVITFDKYSFGKGVLTNIDFNRFIKFLEVAKLQEQNQAPESEDQITKVEKSQSENINVLMENLESEQNQPLYNQQKEEISHDNIQFQQLKQPVLTLNELFKNQFNMEFYNSINLQQQEQFLPVYFDDERIALVVLIACCMISPITATLIGERYSGKSTLLKASQLIVRDICISHYSVINDLYTKGQVYSFQEKISNHYLICNEVVQKTSNEEIKLEHSDNTTIKSQVMKQLFNSINVYLIENLSQIQQYYREYQDLKKIQKKILLILSIFQNQNTSEEIISQNIIDEDDMIITDLEQQWLQKQNNEDSKQHYHTIFKYQETVAFPCFILHCTQFDLNTPLHDNIVSILRDHAITLHNAQDDNLLSTVKSDIYINKQIGAVDISDTSFIIEIPQQNTFLNGNNSLVNVSQIYFQIPNINLSFLRKYFRFLHHIGHTHMNEEWVQSFLNGMNLIATDLPPKLFENFLFFKLILSGHMYHFPTYKNIVVQQKRLNKIQEQGNITISIKQLTTNMIPSTWAQIITNYDKINQIFEQSANKNNFGEFLSQIIEANQSRQQKVSSLQRTMAFNQDHIFESLDIYSLINALKSQQIDNERIISMLERFTSLNMLGYLNVQNSITDKTVSKLRIKHPWQDTQKHGQLYICLKAVLVQMLLNVYRSREKGQIIMSKTLDKLFANKFVKQIYKQMMPVQHSFDQFNKILPFSRTFKAFLFPNQQNDIYNILLDEYAEKNAFQILLSQGLIASGIQQFNTYFLGHIIQMYNGCTDQIDPMLLLLVFKMTLQIEAMKQKNVSIMKTQIQTFNTYQQPHDQLTGIHAVDYLSNFKYLIIEIMRGFMLSKVKQNPQEEEKQELLQAQAQALGETGALLDKMGSYGSFVMKNTSKIFKNKSDEQFAVLIQNASQDKNASKQSQSSDKVKDPAVATQSTGQLPGVPEDRVINENAGLNNEHFEVNDDLMNEIDDMTDDDDKESSTESEELEDQEFGGFHSTMLQSIQIPKFVVKLNSNGNSNQYNKFINCFANIAGYSVASNETFKEAFKQMAKTEAELEEDISDNQSVSSKMSGTSGTSTGSALSAASSVMSVQQQQEFDEELQQVQKLQREQSFNTYRLGAQAYSFFTQRRQDRKIIIDVQNILNTILTQSNKGQKKKKSKRRNADQKAGTADLLNQLHQFMNDLQQNDQMTVDSIEFLVILQIIRFGILLSLGIKPNQAFNQNFYQKNSINIAYSNQAHIIGLTINSQLQSGTPSSVIQKGKLYGDLGILNSQMNTRTCVYKDLNDDETKFYEVIQQLGYPDYDNQNEKLKQKLNSFYEVMIICPKSILKRCSLDGSSMLTMINQLLAQNTFLQYIFDDEEVQNICRLLSLNLGFKSMFSIQDLNAFLSILFSFLVIDDDPAVTSIENEFGADQLAIDVLENIGQVDNIIEHFSNAIEIAQCQKTTCENQLIATQFNCIDYKVNDILFLFQVSECPLPEEYQFPFTFYDNFREYQITYAQCCVFTYRKISKLCDSHYVSFHEFSQICCNMVNNINKKVSEILQLINFIYIIYHYFDALALPTQTTPSVQELDDFTIDRMINKIIKDVKNWTPATQQRQVFDFNIFKQIIQLLQLNEQSAAQMLNKNSQIDKFGPQVIISIYESMEIRNVLFTLLEHLKTLTSMMYIYQKASCFDGILQSLYLTFEQSGNVNHVMIMDQIRQGKLSKSKGNCLQVVKGIIENEQDDTEDFNFDLFLIFCVATMQQAGFNVDIGINGVELVRQGDEISPLLRSRKQTTYVCQKYCSSNIIHNQMIQFNALDSPILLILQTFGIKQKRNDPELMNLHNLNILTQIQKKSLYFIPQHMLQSCCCLLEAIDKQKHTKTSFIRQTLNIIDGQPNGNDQRYIFELLKKIQILDLETSTREFNQSLARSVAISDNLLVFANLGSKANQDNYSTLRKFLQLRARKVIKKRQTVLIGQQSSLCNQALHNFKIIISYKEGCDVKAELNKIGLYYQDFIDQAVFLGKRQSVQLLREQPGYVQSQLFQAVFGERNTYRFFAEEFRAVDIQVIELLKKMKRVSINYFWFNVFDSAFQREIEEENERKRKELLTAAIEKQNKKNMAFSKMTEQPEQSEQVEQTEQVDQADPDNDDDEQKQEEDNAVKIADEQFIEKLKTYQIDQKTIIKTNIQHSASLNQNNQQKEELLHVILTVRELVQLQQLYAQMITNNIINIDQPTAINENEGNDKQILETIYYKSPKAAQLRIKRYQKTNDAKNSAKTVIMKIGMRYCSQISIALEYVFDIIKNLSQTYISTSYVLSDILIDKFCQLLQEDLEDFIQRCKEIQDPDQTRESRDQVDMKDKYPIEYAISYEKELLNDHLIRTILPHLQELLVPSIPLKYNKGFFLLINLIFISLLEFDEPITSKKQISAFIEKIMNSMHSTEIDDIRSITGNQIINVFSENSKYYVDPKYYVDNDIIIENLTQFLPQITSMSESLQESWMKLITCQNYPEISCILPWLLKHHSTFVTISQCNNLFAAFLLYYHEKRPGSFFQIFGHLDLNRIDNAKKETQKKDSKQENKEKLDQEKGEEGGEEEQHEPEQHEEMDFEDLQAKSQKTRDQLLQALKTQSEDDRKITVLPQQIEELNVYSLNTILLICNILQPYNLSQNIDFYMYFIMGCLNLKERLAYDVLVDRHCTNVDTQVTGTVQNYEFTSQQDRIRALTKCSLDLNLLYTNMLLQLSSRKFEYVKNLPQNLVSESCYVLTELLQISVTQTQHYYNRISSIMNSDDYDPQKHQQYLTSLGRTPDNVFVVFYNENADLRTILTTLYDNVTSSIFRNVPLIFTNFFNIQQSQEQITIAFADPSSGGDEIVKRLTDLMMQKNTIYQYTLLMPIFLMIKQSSRPLVPEIHKTFLVEFQRLVSTAPLTVAFIQRPQTLKQQYTQTLFFTMVECRNQIFQQDGCSINQAKKYEMRLFSVFFEQMYIQTLQAIQPSDAEIQQMLRVVLGAGPQPNHLPIDLSRDQYQFYLMDRIHSIFQKPKTIEELFHLFIKLLFMPRQVAYNMQKGKQQMTDVGVDNLMSQLENDAMRIQNTLHKDKNEENETNQQGDEENEEKELLEQQENQHIVIDFTQLQGNEEFSEDELNFRDDMSEDAEDVDEEENNTAAQGNDIGDEMAGETIQNIEESPYSNVIAQLVLYESSQNIAGQLNVDSIQQNIIKLIKCQKRIMREQKTDIHVRALLQMALTVYQTVHVETQFQQLVPAIFLIQKYYVQFAGQQTRAQNVLRSVMNSQVVLRCIYGHIKTQKVPFPSLLNQFIMNLRQQMVPRLGKQLSPRYLFSGLVSSKLNRQLNAVIGEGEFGAYEDSWVFGAAAFADVLEETLAFIRFRGSVLGGQPLGNQRLLLLLEKKVVKLADGKLSLSDPGQGILPCKGGQAAPAGQNAQNNPQGLPDDFYVILRELELINASVDAITGLLCHDNVERRVGYRQTYDAYCYTIASQEPLPELEGHSALPLIVNGRFVASIYVRCKAGTATDDIFFTVTKL